MHASGYRSLIAPLASRFAELAEDILQPIRHIPRHPLLLARFSTFALRSAVSLARSHFTGKRAKAFFAGMATHSALSLETVTSAAVGLVLMAAGHASGWPILRGGAQVSQMPSLAIWKILAVILRSITKLRNSRRPILSSPTSLLGNFFVSQARDCLRATSENWSVSTTVPAPSRLTML